MIAPIGNTQLTHLVINVIYPNPTSEASGASLD